MSSVKNHERVGDSEKVPYKRWIYFRELMEEALTHLSVREVALRMGKDSPGWAGKARDHRGLVGERDVGLLEELVEELRENSTEEVMVESPEEDDVQKRKDRFRNAVAQLRDSGIGDETIARAMDYQRAREVNRLLHTPGMAPPSERILLLEAAVPTLVMGRPQVNGSAPGEEEVVPEVEEPVQPEGKGSMSAPLGRIRERLLEAAQEAEEARAAYPSVFAKVLDSYRDRILDIASELE